MIRPGCGSPAGALAHAAAGEAPCGWCLRAEAVARLEAEGVPCRPPGDLPFAPVTETEAEQNAAVLAAEAGAHERGPLRVIPGGAA